MISYKLTVGGLIEILQDCNEGDYVWVARDPEGNGYSPLDMDTSWVAIHDDEVWFPGDMETGDENCNAIVLWPKY